MKNIITDKYELIDVRRIRSGSQSAQFAIMRVAYHPDRLYAWQGHHNNPRNEWVQQSIETRWEFLDRVKHDLKNMF